MGRRAGAIADQSKDCEEPDDLSIATGDVVSDVSVPLDTSYWEVGSIAHVRNVHAAFRKFLAGPRM